MKKIIIFSTFLFLTSCFGLPSGVHHYEYSEWKDFPNINESDSKKGRSIILTKISNRILIDNDLIKKEYNSLGMAWVGGKINNNETDPGFWYTSTLYSLKEKDGREVFYTEPGDYLLLSIGNIAIIDVDNSGFALSHQPKLAFYDRGSGFLRLKNNQTFIEPKYLLDEKRKPLLASFTANSDEIVYIGDITLTTSVAGATTGNINFEVKDNYEEALKDFRKKYPQFKNRIVIKRLMNLGRFVDKEKNAKFKVPPREFLFGRFRADKEIVSHTNE